MDVSDTSAAEKPHCAFEAMRFSAIERLMSRSYEEIARHAGAVFDREQSALQLCSLGQHIRISVPEYRFVPQMEEWYQLVILHYLDIADGTPVSPQMISFGELNNGLIRGTKYDRTAETALQAFLRGKSREAVQQVCKKLGAEFLNSNADLCAVFRFLPNYPLWLKIWFADEEFETAGKLYLSRTADHYLTIEDAVTVGDIFLKKLIEQSQENVRKAKITRKILLH